MRCNQRNRIKVLPFKMNKAIMNCGADFVRTLCDVEEENAVAPIFHRQGMYYDSINYYEGRKVYLRSIKIIKRTK